ncbi:hypothetical protein BDR06DRAFT_948544 [Suillus hirtellus]|nr:hypothetical protein BDR06DRAFT_948544 [Suillus hirtellus]
MNSLPFLEVYLGLRVCTMAHGTVVGDLKNTLPECMSSPGKVLSGGIQNRGLSNAKSSTFLEVKLKRSPEWWVEVPCAIGSVTGRVTYTHGPSQSGRTEFTAYCVNVTRVAWLLNRW